MAPEILLSDNAGYNHWADIFSLGVVQFIMINLVMPFTDALSHLKGIRHKHVHPNITPYQV